MTDFKPVSRFESLYSSGGAATHYTTATPVRSAVHHSYTTATPIRTVSTSPARKEIHQGAPIVERVVEYENMCTPELMACAASTKVEAEKMRIRSAEYERLVEEHRALSELFSSQCQINGKARADHEATIHGLAVSISQNSSELNSGKIRLDNTRRHISNLTECHKRNMDGIATTDIEISKVKVVLDGLAADKVTMLAQHKAQVDELNGLYEANHKTSIEIHEVHVQNNTKSSELHNLTVQVTHMEQQKEHQLRQIETLEQLVAQRTKDCSEADERIILLQSEIASCVSQIAVLQSKIDSLKIEIETIVASNQKLSDQVHETSVRNCELSANINDLTVRSHALESRISCMRSECENCKTSNGIFLDNNSNLQTQVTTMKGHNGVLGGQNVSISTELQSFVNANEAMRVQLDRRARVFDQCRRNEENIINSVTEVHRSRSPMRRVHTSMMESYHHLPVETFHHSPVRVVHHSPVRLATFAPVDHFYAPASHTRSFTATYQASSSPLMRAHLPENTAPASPAPGSPAPASPAMAAQNDTTQIKS